MSAGKDFDFGLISSVSEIDSSPEVYKIMWTIQDFQNQYSEVEEFYESPHFFTGVDERDEWSLDIYLNGFDKNTSEYIAVRAWLCTYQDDRNIVVQFALLDRDGKKHWIETAPVRAGRGGVITSYIKNNDLLKNAEQMLPDDEMRILCHIFYLPNLNDNAEKMNGICSSHNGQFEGFAKLLNNEKYSDFKLIVKEKEFCVHRAVLAARSPVFEAMFDSNMLETSEGKAYIHDIEPNVIEKLLEFVYTGDIHFENLIDKVLVAAEKYQFNSLKTLCEKELARKLSIDNVYDILLLADHNNAAMLRKRAVKFFNEHLKELFTAGNSAAFIDSLPSSVKTEIIRVMARKRVA